MDSLRRYLPYICIVLPALAFIAAGGAKLAGVEQVHASFKAMGMPSWFGYFIGLCEVAGGIALFIAALRKLAAAGLAVIMVGAIYFHLAYDVPSPIPATVLLMMMLFVMWWNWRGSPGATA